MCGITGWVDFSRDLRAETERRTLEAMTATMAARGPDDEGLWVSAHAALGHRRLAVIDLTGGRQPMAAGSAVITYSGEVYNHVELRQELQAAGHVFHTRSDTEVVLHAYLRWGTGMVDRLNGMYAFAIWDEAEDELLLVRDRMGVKPLYYRALGDGLLFGSEPKAILANPDVDRVLDPVGFCSSLIMMPSPEGRTPLRDVWELPPGHVLRFSRRGVQKQRYWALEARPHEDDFETTVAHVRELLDDIVTRQLVADVPLCVLLSGGIDSSAITALAQRAQGDALRSFAVDFTGYLDDFQPDELRSSPDRPFVAEVVRHVGCTHRDVMVDTEQLWDPVTRRAVLHAWDLPNHLGDMDVSLHLLFRAIREQSTVAVSGEAADEVFGGYPWAHDAQALEVELFPWMAYYVNQGTPPPFSLYDPGLVERLKLWDFLFDSYRQAVAEVPRLEGEEREQARMREVNHFDLTRFVRGLLDRKDRMSMATGLEVRVPFCDHRLVEYVFNVPWSMKSRDGRPKALLREAARDLLPPAIVDRPKSAFPATQDRRYDQMLMSQLRRILDGDGDGTGTGDAAEAGDDPIRPFVDTEAAGGLVHANGSGNGGSAWSRLRVESVVRTNAWLRDYGVDVSGLREPEPLT